MKENTFEYYIKQANNKIIIREEEEEEQDYSKDASKEVIQLFNKFEKQIHELCDKNIGNARFAADQLKQLAFQSDKNFQTFFNLEDID